MTDAVTSLVNSAFAQLGEDPVSDVTLTPTPARVTKIMPHVQDAIDAVLVRYGWLCALEYATIYPEPTIPGNWRFQHHYVIPEGGLCFWRVERTTGWERGVQERDDGATRDVLRAIEGGALNVAYVKRREAEALTVNVRDAVAFELAARACQSITGNGDLALKLQKAAAEALSSAIGSDGRDAKDEAMLPDRLACIRASAP